MNKKSNRQAIAGVWGLLFGLLAASSAPGGPLQPPGQVGNLLEMTNANVRLEYNLSTGRANFYWQNALKIAGFYAGAALPAYTTDTVYTNRTWTWTNNEVDVTSTRGDLPPMVQVFILDQDNSFLTRVQVQGPGLQSSWMGPVIMDTAGGVDIGITNDNRALIVPWDNNSWTYNYNGLPINNTSFSYEVGAFYDNTTRNGLVVGSVTHDQWKTGIYFQGANNKLSVMNVYGGVTWGNAAEGADVMGHGLVTGNPLVSATVFVGFGTDWRTVMAAYAAANVAVTPALTWDGGVPFGWNSWYAYGSSVTYSNATNASAFIKNNLQTNQFNDQGTVYINLDSYWSNLSDSQLQQFSAYCHSNGQKAGIYWSPFVYWGTASQGSNVTMTGSSYLWSAAYLRTNGGGVQSPNNQGIALDPTHPGTLQMISYYMNYFKSHGFDYLKLDFLTHGALEGTHYDPSITTGIAAYNKGMQYLLQQNNGRMFLNESIAPLFPYQYAHSRRIGCDTSGNVIASTAFELACLTYGWWISGCLYPYSDPDIMQFAGGTTYENQSRVISGAISGTVFLNGDDLGSTTEQSLATTCLTNPRINEVARAGASFLPVENNVGTNSIFVRQVGGTWYVAVFNYTGNSTSPTLNLSRLGISGTYTAQDLWSGALSTVSGTTWQVSLNRRQAKLFRLGSGSTSATPLTNQAVFAGGAVTFSTTASGTPPFNYVWRRNGTAIGQNANNLSLNPVGVADAGTYTVEVTGGSGSVTNSATLTVYQVPFIWAAGNGPWDFTSPGLWTDSVGTSVVYQNGVSVLFNDSATGAPPIQVSINQPVAPSSVTVSNATKDYTFSGNGSMAGASPVLLKSGPGTLTLAMSNSFSGILGINGGTIQFGQGGTNGAPISGTVTNNATLAFNRSDVYTLPSLSGAYPAFLGGPGTLKQIGPGKLVFNYQYVFGTWLSTPRQGLYVGPGSTAETTAYNPVGPVTLEGGTLSSAGGAAASYESWVLSGGVTVLSNAQTAVITNNTTVNAFSQIELRDPTVFNVASGATNGVDLLVPAALTHSYWEYGNWGTLVKSGTGRMVLLATNLYQGGTIISNGLLVVNSPGSIGASGFPLTVQAGGHFGGTGTIQPNVSVQAGGFLEPGDGAGAIGILTVNGNLTLAGTTVMKLNKSVSPSNDMVVVTNGLTYGGTLTVTNAGPALAAGDSFKLFSQAGTASFGTVNPPSLSGGLAWTNRLAVDGSIAVIQTVNLTPMNLAFQASSSSLTLDWPPDHVGWWLQAQTNNTGGGIGTNWIDLPNSAATNAWVVPIDPLNQSVFFRLIYR